MMKQVPERAAPWAPSGARHKRLPNGTATSVELRNRKWSQGLISPGLAWPVEEGSGKVSPALSSREARREPNCVEEPRAGEGERSNVRTEGLARPSSQRGTRAYHSGWPTEQTRWQQTCKGAKGGGEKPTSFGLMVIWYLPNGGKKRGDEVTGGKEFLPAWPRGEGSKG